jgi:hypothetical protein
MIADVEVIKHELILFMISVVIILSSCIKALVDAAVHSEDGKVIKCDFKPGSVERSIDRYQRGVYLSKVQAAGDTCNLRHQ